MNRREVLYGLFAGVLMTPSLSFASVLPFETLRELKFGPHFLEEIDSYLSRYHFRIPSDVAHSCGVLKIGDFSIFHHVFRRENSPMCLLLHGYLDHSGIHGDVISDLLSAGWSVCAIDLPGHGLSSGNRGDIANFDDYQRILKGIVESLETKPIAAIGHSTGAAVLAHAVLEGHPFKHVVLISPLYHSEHWKLSKFGAFLLPRNIRIPRRKTMVSADPNFQIFRLTDPLFDKSMPLRWAHSMFEWAERFQNMKPSPLKIAAYFGNKDIIIDEQANAEMYRHLFPNAEIEWHSGGNHHLLYESQPIRRVVRTKMLRFISPGLAGL